MEKMYVEVRDQTFEQEVLKSDIPVLVDFGAEWCGPCKMILPAIEEIAREYQGKIKVVKIDVDENPETTIKYRIKGLPTIIFFNQGEVKDKVTGAVSKKVLEEKLQAA